MYTNVYVISVKINVKVKLSLGLSPRHEDVLGERKYCSTHSLTSALDGGDWSASHPGRLTYGERDPFTH
jgi:hypothetical protein